MTRVLAPLLLLVSACGTDVLLGGAVDTGSDALPASDAGSDAGLPDAGPPLTPFPDGSYMLTIAPTATESLCTGPSLTGMESAFASVTRDSLGLAEGEVAVGAVDAMHLDVTGAPIETGFRAATVRLEKGGGPGVPPEVWIGVGPRADGGPLDTALIGILLEAHETTVTPSGFDGRVSAWYVDPLVEDSQCVLGFAARFTAP
jgi:hypothetical protein